MNGAKPAPGSAGTVLVLGAAGFIGRHACRALHAEGLDVLGMGHGTWSAAEASTWGIDRFLQADVSIASLGAIAGDRPLRAIVHCAGSGSVSASYDAPFGDFERSVSSTAAMLEFVRRGANGTPRVVLTSSAAVYGDQGEIDVAETAARAPISPYGFHKRAAEDLCDAASRFFATEASIVRLFSVYGDGLRKQLLWDAMRKFSRGESSFFGTGHELRDWIHVSDAGRLLCLAATMPQSRFEIYNGGHTKASTRDVLGRLVAGTAFAVEPRFNGQTHAGNPRRLTADASHARRQLGWSPEVTLADGLARYASWFCELPSPP